MPTVDHDKRVELAARRFWARVDQSQGAQSCWEYRGSRPRGYGSVNFAGKTKLAHRVSFFLEFGEWPEAVLHSCDNPACCNPAHLEAGDRKKNMADAAKRDRVEFGSRHHNAKLNEDKVRSIRIERANGASYRSLSASYGVSEQALCDLVKRRTWRRVL